MLGKYHLDPSQARGCQMIFSKHSGSVIQCKQALITNYSLGAYLFVIYSGHVMLGLYVQILNLLLSSSTSYSNVNILLNLRLITISSCAQSHPSSIAMRYLQRKCIMCDPNWNKGHYYDGAYPKVGMKLARFV